MKIETKQFNDAEMELLMVRIERLLEEIIIEHKSGKPDHRIITQNRKSIIRISNWISEDTNKRQFKRHE